MEVLNNAVADKFCGLLQYLCKYRNDFEMIADEIEDENLKTALNGLSSDSWQYVSEISCQLKLYGIPHRVETNLLEESLESNGDSLETVGEQRGGELSTICFTSERSITKAYTDILNEYLPLSNLRNIMLYQLNTLKLAFMKVRLINEARFAAH